MSFDWEVIQGDCLEVMAGMESGSVQCCITSPPYYGLRDYGNDGQIGLEDTPEQYVEKMVEVFREVRRILKEDGTLWLNIGDSYANDGKWGGNTGGKHVTALHGNTCIGRHKKKTGLQPKNLIGIPWRVAFALQADGWCLRQDIIWNKPNAMPESVKDRCTKVHEYIFLMSKSAKYFYDIDSVREPQKKVSIERAQMADMRKKHGWSEAYHGNPPKGLANQSKRNTSKGRNLRSVWTVSTKANKEAHFATYPPNLIVPCVDAGSKKGDTIFDPFTGSGTTGAVAVDRGRKFIGSEISSEYCEIARRRIDEASRQRRLF